MSKDPKLTKAEAFRAILEEARVDAIEEELEALEKPLAGKSDEELSAELEKMGVSRAEADEIHARQMKMIDEAKATAPPKLAEVVPLRRRFGVLVGFGLAAALALAALAALLLAITRPHPGTDGGIVPEPDRAEQLRDLAFDECSNGHWESCLEKLDQAQAIDPKSNDLPKVKDARDRADRALHPEEEYDAYGPAQNNGRKRPPPR